ncbi:MAG: hypothetical protein J7497_15920 [Chitinophagaceae bacterium]|nr:hypothetical protein [Chitinophagaceae bacterium]
MPLSIIKLMKMSLAYMSDRNSEVENCVEAKAVVIASANDQHIFFDTIMNPPMPSRQLHAALKKYQQKKTT